MQVKVFIILILLIYLSVFTYPSDLKNFKSDENKILNIFSNMEQAINKRKIEEFFLEYVSKEAKFNKHSVFYNNSMQIEASQQLSLNVEDYIQYLYQILEHGDTYNFILKVNQIKYHKNGTITVYLNIKEETVNMTSLNQKWFNSITTTAKSKCIVSVLNETAKIVFSDCIEEISIK